jgi:hypothetical protein
MYAHFRFYQYLFIPQQLTRKNLMVKNLKRLRKQTEREQGKTEAQRFVNIKNNANDCKL